MLVPSILSIVAVAVVGYLIKLFLGGRRSVVFLDGKRQKLQLAEKVNVSHDTCRFRFALPSTRHSLGLPVGKHIKFYGPNKTGCEAGSWNGRVDLEDTGEIERKYTPVSGDDRRGFVEFVIKVYRGGIKANFPDGGKMSQYLDSLKVGQFVDVTGPWGSVEYKGLGVFQHRGRLLEKKHVGMLAGGTGITPMLQLINSILSNKNDRTEISLLFANQSEEDILLREHIDDLSRSNVGRFKVWYTVDKAQPEWKFSEGFITSNMIKEHLPPPGDDTVVLMCGPPPMVKFACKANLDTLGYPAVDQIEF